MLNVGMLKMHARRMETNLFIFIHGMSGSLLRCVSRTCSYRDDNGNSIYQAALLHIRIALAFSKAVSFADMINVSCHGRSLSSKKKRSFGLCTDKS